MALNISQIQSPSSEGSPFQRAIGGFRLGREELDQSRAQEAQLQQAQAKKERQAAAQSALTGLAANRSATGRDFANVMLQFPELGEQIKQSFDVLSTSQKDTARRDTLNVFAALESGRVDIAKEFVQNQLDASNNSGDAAGAATAEALLKIMEDSPDDAQAAAGLFLANTMGDGEFDNVLSELRARKEQRDLAPIQKKKLIAESELTAAQANKVIKDTEKLGQDITKSVLELEALKQGGLQIPPEKKFDLEKKIRDEFKSLTSGSLKIERSAANILTSLATGAGDIALITSFMKMMDPESTVREGEFHIAATAGGVVEKWKNIGDKILKGDLLSAKNRQGIKDQAKIFLDNTRKDVQKVKRNLGPVIKNYTLNPENIFGPIAEESAIVPAGELSSEDLEAELAALQSGQTQ